MRHLVGRAARAGLAAAMLATTGGCTALRVITHETTVDLAAVKSARYEIDPHHASVHFKVLHFGYSFYVGRFDEIAASLDFAAEDPTRSRLEVRIRTASVDTNNPELEEMLRGRSMFDSAAFPEATFVSRGIERTGPASGRISGELTVKGRTAPLTLDVVFHGAAPNPLTGEDTLGFSATGTFSRAALGLTAWEPAVGDEVTLEIEAEFVRAD